LVLGEVTTPSAWMRSLAQPIESMDVMDRIVPLLWVELVRDHNVDAGAGLELGLVLGLERETPGEVALRDVLRYQTYPAVLDAIHPRRRVVPAAVAGG
jgi:hypothetical protein